MAGIFMYYFIISIGVAILLARVICSKLKNSLPTMSSWLIGLVGGAFVPVLLAVVAGCLIIMEHARSATVVTDTVTAGGMLLIIAIFTFPFSMAAGLLAARR
ncbi:MULTISPECIES: hypothetical protein [unclassified Sphingomonas]|jgi:hypothetical protein|nr:MULTISPECIES: hypothetical protein [unclassified Sphingomonas]